jgi:8-oxo-dGTP pyrophosphatase MutT (NUDIX family)
MRERAAIIIRKNERILLIHRHKNGRDYYVIPGGGIKTGETPLQAALREIGEETSLEVWDVRPFWQFNNRGNTEYYFYTENFAGHPELGGPELQKMSEENDYRLCWVEIKQLQEIPLMPPQVILEIQARF